MFKCDVKNIDKQTSTHIMEKPIKKAAQFRAAVMSIIGSSKEPVVMPDLLDMAVIKDIGIGDQQARQTVTEMAKNGGPLQRVYVSRPEHPHVRYGYEIRSDKPRKQEEPIVSEIIPAVKRKIKRPAIAHKSDMPEIKINAHHKSGALNINVNGVNIEISVDAL